MMSPKAAIKRGRTLLEEEDAGQLKLGEEFQHSQCLMISEVAILLEFLKEKRSMEGLPEKQNVVFEKTMAYSKRFSRYNKEAAREVRHVLSCKGIENFEISLLGNLCPETAEEAKALIPR
jgi:DNA-directed RNA polymerase II subunit RPB4